MILRFFLNLIFLISIAEPTLAVDIEIKESLKCISLFTQFEDQNFIPHDTLHSIALKESGKQHSIHKMSIPWPWTVNVEGDGYYFKSKKEAINFVKRKIIEGKESIDVGCMQINLKHHTDAFDSLEEAFDPFMNIAYAAKFLKTKYDILKSWHKAIAHYHSATFKHGFKYKQDVLKIANKIDDYRNLFNKHLYDSSLDSYIYEENKPVYSTNNYIGNRSRERLRSNILVQIFPRSK